MLCSGLRKVNKVQVSPTVKRKCRPQKKQRLLLMKPHRIPNPPNHTLTQLLQNTSQAQARLPPRTPPRPPPTKLPSPLPETPTKMKPPAPTKYVRAYQAAGKDWLDTAVKDGEEAYIRLFNELLKLRGPYIDNFTKQIGNKYSSVSETKQAGS